MPGMWKITQNFVGGEYFYAVYRLRNVDEVDHSGNREFASDYFENREDAQAILDKLKN